MLNNTSSDFDLTIRQQPNRARVAGGKEKGTWEISLSLSVLYRGSGLGSNRRRAQTDRPAPDRPAPGARGGNLPRAVSVDSQMAVRRLMRCNRHYLQSPYYFMCCSLYDATEERPVPVAPSTALAGTLVSSLHRLKDMDNSG